MDIIEELAIRGRKRLAVAKNAAAWALFGNDAEGETTISAEDAAVAQIIAIRVLTRLKEAGLIDNEPLLGLATTDALLKELEARGQMGDTKDHDILYASTSVLRSKLSSEVMTYKTGTIRPILDDDTLADATVRGLLNEIQTRYENDSTLSALDAGGWLHYHAVKALEDVPPVALDYSAANTVAVIEDEDPISNGDDAEEADPK